MKERWFIRLTPKFLLERFHLGVGFGFEGIRQDRFSISARFGIYRIWFIGNPYYCSAIDRPIERFIKKVRYDTPEL